MNKTKLNYRFHNPNTQEETVKYISKIFMEVSHNKFDRILKERANKEIIVIKECPTI